MKTNIILNGDALTHLKEIPDKSINMCMTSPPYWALRDYGTASWVDGDDDCKHEIPEGENDPKNENNSSHNVRFIRAACYKCGAKRVDKQLGLEPTFEEYITKLCDIFDEVKRVLRDDGTCWVNLGDTYGGVGHSDWSNNESWNTGKLNDNKDFKLKKNHPQKSLVMIPFRFAIEMVNRGWILRNVIIWHKPNAMPSSVKDRFTVDFEYLFFFSKKKKYYFETQYEKSITGKSEKFNSRVRDVKRGYQKSGQYKASQKEVEQYHGGNIITQLNRNKRSTWSISPKPFSEAHFAVYPEELCEIPIKAGCSEGGIVLDPFFGAGTTGLVALKQNKKFIGIELNPEYIEIAKKRLNPFLEQEKLY